jgi:hypothetical protein
MIRDEYEKLRDELNYHTGHFSAIARVKRHPAYQKIVGLGKELTPIILAEFDKYLQTDENDDFPGHWAMAVLHELSGANPYENCQAGVVDQMIRAWIKWGEGNGHLAKDRPKYEKPAPIIYKGWIVVGYRHGEESVLCPKREPENAFEEAKGTAAWVSKVDAARKVDDGWWKKYALILPTKREAEIALDILNEKIKNGECSKFNTPDKAWVEEL